MNECRFFLHDESEESHIDFGLGPGFIANRYRIGNSSTKIIDGLFLGNAESATDLDFLTSIKCQRIVNCAGNSVPNLFARFGIRYLTFRQNIFDSHKKTPKKIVKFIESALNKGQSVLVHSLHGRSRSTIVVAAYLMMRFHWSVQKCLEFIRFRRPDGCQPKPQYERQLRAIAHSMGVKEGKSYSTAESRWIEKVPRDMTEECVRNTFLNGHPILAPEEAEVEDLSPGSEKLSPVGKKSQSITWGHTQVAEEYFPPTPEHKVSPRQPVVLKSILKPLKDNNKPSAPEKVTSTPSPLIKYTEDSRPITAQPGNMFEPFITEDLRSGNGSSPMILSMGGLNLRKPQDKLHPCMIQPQRAKKKPGKFLRTPSPKPPPQLSSLENRREPSYRPILNHASAHVKRNASSGISAYSIRKARPNQMVNTWVGSNSAPHHRPPSLMEYKVKRNLKRRSEARHTQPVKGLGLKIIGNELATPGSSRQYSESRGKKFSSKGKGRKNRLKSKSRTGSMLRKGGRRKVSQSPSRLSQRGMQSNKVGAPLILRSCSWTNLQHGSLPAPQLMDDNAWPRRGDTSKQHQLYDLSGRRTLW